MDSPLCLIKLQVIIRSLNYEFTARTATIKRRESSVREKGDPERKKKEAGIYSSGVVYLTPEAGYD